jgi:hypothetical protein
MKWPRRRLLSLAFGVTVALGAFVAFYVGLTGRTVKLTDGREIVVRSASWGTNHFYVEGKWWLKPVRRYLAVPRATQMGLRSYRLVTPDPALVLWAHCYWPSNMTPTNRFPLLVAAVDATGVSAEPMFQSLLGGNTIPNRSESLAFWHLQNFPRRRNKFDVAVYAVDDSGQPHRVGTTRVSNPTPGEFPRWKRAAMPATNVSDGLELVLLNLASAQPTATALRKSRGWFGLWNDAVLVLRDKGQLNPDWRVASVAATDATGNRWFDDRPEVAPVGDNLVCGFCGTLWPEEPAWNVQFELVRISGFAPEELRELKGIPLPQAGTISSNVLQIDIHGVTGGVVELERNITPSFPRQNFFLRLNTGRGLRGVRIMLLAATDELGRRVRTHNSNPLAPPQCLWGLDVADGASSLDVTFAIQSGHFFDFTVTPR